MNSYVLQMTVDNAKNGNTRSAWLLEEEIARRGLQSEYIDALMQTVGYPAIGENHWLLLHATPEQRAQAFVAVCALEREV